MTSTAARVPRVRPRDPDEPHRSATPLELLFDLVFVVAVSFAAGNLHGALQDGRVGAALVGYPAAFFGIWWAWMNFTWFASSYDSDDWLYRLLTFTQMAGVLIFAAGLSALYEDHPLTLAVLGYVIMRVAMVTQWLRASRADAVRAAVTRAYASGIVGVQALWLLSLLVPSALRLPAFAVLAAVELAVPGLAERRGPHTPWHPRHIAERYGLFTIIVLGETVSASARVFVDAVDEGEHVVTLVLLALSALVLVAAMWWVYFDRQQDQLLDSVSASFRWGYGHYFAFAAAGALAAGIELGVDRALDRTGVGHVTAGMALAVPVAVFLLVVWLLALRPAGDPVVDRAVPALAAAVLVAGLLPGAAVAVALLAAATAGVVGARGPVPA